VTSYDGRIVISPTSCRDLMPDPEVFTQCVRDSFQEYLAVAALPPKAAPRPKRQPPAVKKIAAAAAPGKPARKAPPRASSSGRRPPKDLRA